MSTANGPSEWVKWVAGLALMLNGVVFSYAISIESRLSKQEADAASHIEKAKEDKAEVFSRLNRQDENSAQLIKIINGVALDVATIKGYFERNKDRP